MIGSSPRPHPQSTEGLLSAARRSVFVVFFAQERRFLLFVLVAFLFAAATYQTPSVAMWVGFLFAGYAAVGNDSIQTIGTFLASNREKPWWLLWLFVGGIFVLTTGYSWAVFDGDVSYERLSAKGFAEAPTEFSFLQVAAPIFLLVLTRLKMPVSTTFLLLTAFATKAKGVESVLLKSVSGYAVSFATAFVVWGALGRWMQDRWQGPAHPLWRGAQWITSGLLWSFWLQQDAANIAVYLPRSLSLAEYTAFAGIIVAGLGMLLYARGERIQEVVEEKSNVLDVRFATAIDVVYAVILYVFKVQSRVPMSTTWVFIGLLAGRELALVWQGAAAESQDARGAFKMIARDVLYVTTGLLVSMLIALAGNDTIRAAWLGG